MVSHQERYRWIGLVLLLVVLSAQAETTKDISANPNYIKNMELSAAGGVDWYTISDTHLIISPFETDKNKVDDPSAKGTWKIGVGYYLFDESLRRRDYLNHLLLELNLYQTFASVTGDVLQYELLQFNNYNFDAPVTSTRLMFDFKPSLFTWKNMTPYPILGMGVTWNSISYHEKPEESNIDRMSRLILSKHTMAQFAWEVGVGVNVVLNEYLSISGEYIYAFLGKGFPANDPANGVRLVTAPSFSLQNQSLLFGINIKV